jgi:hypothetical protein
VTLVSVSVVGLLFGGFAVILAIPVTSAVATMIDVFVLDHEPPAETFARRTTRAPPQPGANDRAGRCRLYAVRKRVLDMENANAPADMHRPTRGIRGHRMGHLAA